MFEITIDLSVKLNSGATISITPDQHKRITTFAREVVLGEATKTTPQPKRRYALRKARTYRAWTVAEDAEIARLVRQFPGNMKLRKGELNKALNEVRSQYMPYRTKASVRKRYNIIKEKQRVPAPNGLLESPVSVRVHG